MSRPWSWTSGGSSYGTMGARYHQAREAKRRAGRRNTQIKSWFRKYGGSWGRKIARKNWLFWVGQAGYYGWKHRKMLKRTWKEARNMYMRRSFRPREGYRKRFSKYDWFDTPPYYRRGRRPSYSPSRRFSRWGRRPYRRYAQDWR